MHIVIKRNDLIENLPGLYDCTYSYCHMFDSTTKAKFLVLSISLINWNWMGKCLPTMWPGLEANPDHPSHISLRVKSEPKQHYAPLLITSHTCRSEKLDQNVSLGSLPSEGTEEDVKKTAQL